MPRDTMPGRTGNIARDAPLPQPPTEHQDFVFPRNAHILVTTPRHIFSWDASGIRKVFHSSRGGVVAATEARDASGVLAVASKDVVVLHDTKRGQAQSWGLNAPEDEVRHLKYSNDAKSLYLSTASDGLIQHYSTARAKLLEPVQKHESAPVALAILPTGHLMLSASSDPPAVYLKNLAHNTASTLIQPNASSTPVCAAAFHPKRPDTFVLAFRDATVAAYDATKISKDPDRCATQVTSGDGEIGRLKDLHRRTGNGDLSLEVANTAAPVVGVAFLPGYKLRAVTAGRDGRCRIVDFANGGAVLRTWHCRAPCTAISVMVADSPMLPGTSRSAPSAMQRQDKQQICGSGLIAVGLMGGKVQLYDAVGIMLVEKAFSSQEEKIISVDWVEGSSPRGIDTSLTGPLGNAEVELSLQAKPGTAATLGAIPKSNIFKSMPSGKGGYGFPAGLKTVLQKPQQTQRQLTFHPDELAASTLRQDSSVKQPGPIPQPAARFDDLFSPVKKTAATRTPQKHVLSLHRSRPRISSQTFVKSPAVQDQQINAKRHKLALSVSSSASSTSSPSSAARQQHPAFRVSKSIGGKSAQASPFNPKNRQVSLKPSALNLGDATAVSRHSAASTRTGPRATVPATAASKHLARVILSRNRDRARAQQPLPEEADQKQIDDEVDIWLTSEDEDSGHQRPRPRRIRPQASAPTITAAEAAYVQAHEKAAHTANAHHIVPPQSNLPTMNIISSISNDVRELFPRSSSLSPRKAHRNQTKKGPPPRPSHQPRTTTTTTTTAPQRPLSTIPPNTVHPRQRDLPRARVRMSKDSPSLQPDSTMKKETKKNKSVRKNAYVTVLQDGSVELPSWIQEHPARGDDAARGDDGTSGNGNVTLQSSATPTCPICPTCPETQCRVRELESDVVRLKSEVLALRALLRRNGVEVRRVFG